MARKATVAQCGTRRATDEQMPHGRSYAIGVEVYKDKVERTATFWALPACFAF